MRHVLLGLLSLLLLVVAAPARISPLAAQELDYSRDVRPILARNCFRCHGQDEETREAGLRLDLRESAMAEADSGAVALVPGNPDGSELFVRVSAADESVRMPPADAGEKLGEAEISTLKHGSSRCTVCQSLVIRAARRSALPSVEHPEWAHNAIDYFILERLEREGLEPSPEAASHLLLRRLSFDLRGLPPTLEEVDAFVNDQHPNAYERLVDRLLSDPAYGERWAGHWLDLARYADSSGLGSDPLRLNMWRYRDWVIDAFNSNLRPLISFTIGQLAGDLLPDGTLQQRMATALHRNTMTNTEGGTDDEEFRVAAVKDRAETTIRVWMGLTMQCANCHDHKYDPISQKDYYRFFAVFNQTADADRGDEAPVMEVPTDLVLEARARIDQQVNDLRQQITAVENRHPTGTGNSSRATPLQGRFVRVELPGKVQVPVAGRSPGVCR